MSENKWTFKELLEKKPYLNHIKQRVFNNSYVVQFWDKPARTIIAHLYKDGNQFIHPDHKQERTITPREAARLQSFPDDFYFEGGQTAAFNMEGNIKSSTFGLLLGAQWKLGKNLWLDWQILGPHYGSANGTITGISNLSLSPTERTSLAIL